MDCYSNLKTSIVMDNGTGYTKMGFAGNLDPDFVIPSAIADVESKSNISVSRTKNEEYNFFIGYQGIQTAKTSQNHRLYYPLESGIISNWDLMEKFWHQSLYNYLKCDPQEHYFVLTEPPMNPPENRENIAEIFFETFNVPGLFIGVQAVFALLGCNQTFSTENSSKSKKKGVKEENKLNEDQISAIDSLTGIVVDSGDGVTHVVPICDGYVLGSQIKHIPIAGKKITKFMMEMIKDRGENVNVEDLYFTAMDIKEKYGYVCKDLVEEYTKWDKKIIDDKGKPTGSKYKKYKGVGKITEKEINIDVGYETFLGPESFFSPEIIDKNWRTPIDELIDITVQQSPIDYRRKLYSNIVLSGGSTLFRNFDKRVEKQLQARVDARLERYSTLTFKPKPIKVNVTNNLVQKHSVWLGGSCFAHKPNFKQAVHTREEYMEKGAACCRFNPVFGSH